MSGASSKVLSRKSNWDITSGNKISKKEELRADKQSVINLMVCYFFLSSCAFSFFNFFMFSKSWWIISALWAVRNFLDFWMQYFFIGVSCIKNSVTSSSSSSCEHSLLILMKFNFKKEIILHFHLQHKHDKQDEKSVNCFYLLSGFWHLTHLKVIMTSL